MGETSSWGFHGEGKALKAKIEVGENRWVLKLHEKEKQL